MLQAQTKTSPPSARLREIPDLPQEPPTPTRGEHLDAKSLERAVASLLSRHPEAPVLAAGTDGVVVAMPPSVPLQRNPVLEPRTGMDLIVTEDRARLLTTWDQVLATGSARCPLRLASEPEVAVMYYGFDVRETHGIVLAVVLPADPSDSPPAPIRERASVAPRFARISKDDSGFIVKIDSAVTQILGWRPEEMEGRRSIDFIHPDDQALAIDNWMEMLVAPGIGRRVRLRHRRHDDTWIWFEVTNNNLLEDPDHRCVVSEMVEIAEEMAREQLLERLAETVPVGLLQIDADRQVVYTNSQLHTILGVERASSVEEQLATVVASDRPALERAFDEVLELGNDAEAEVELRLPATGAIRFCTLKMRALNLDDGAAGGAIACVADVTDSANMREELKKRATFDELTGCYNRPSIMAVLEASVAGGERSTECAVMFIDLDHFKEINDEEGHAAGDELLRVVADRLRGIVRSDDSVGRIGGDEFLVVCPAIGGPEQAMKLAERMAHALRTEVRLDSVGATRPLKVSIGVAWSNGRSVGSDILVARADAAMYESKHERAGQPKLASADYEISASRTALASTE
jgi:diguanylate cyclase (GGDEF)-like protein/PAS domain S-box-containing protein